MTLITLVIPLFELLVGPCRDKKNNIGLLICNVM